MEAPVKIKNPDTTLRVVKLKPYQSLEIVVTGDYGESINMQSEYLRISEAIEQQDRTTYRIQQTKHATGANLYSTFYLGEINLTQSCLLVYLEATEEAKKDIITIVNPGFDTVSMKPYQVLEVVCYNPQFLGEDLWFWEWMTDVQYLDMDQMGYRSSTPYLAPLYSPDPVCSVMPRIIGEHQCTQHHFWFRFEKSVLNVLKDTKFKKPIGKFIFRGFPNSQTTECVESVVEVYLDGNEKHRERCLKTMFLPTFFEEQEDWSGHEMTSKHVRMDVAIKRIDCADLDDGCRVIYDERQLCM